MKIDVSDLVSHLELNDLQLIERVQNGIHPQPLNEKAEPFVEGDPYTTEVGGE